MGRCNRSAAVAYSCGARYARAIIESGDIEIREDWTKVLRRGEEALRERLARPAVPRDSEAVATVDPALVTDLVTPEEAPIPAMVAEPATEIIAPAVPADAAAAVTSDEPTPSPEVASEATAERPPLPHLFAELSTGDRITQPLLYRDRTFLIALGIVAFLSLSSAVAIIPFGDEPPQQSADQEKRGQVEKSETVTVELVENPDAHAKTKLSQMGENAPVAPPVEPAPDQPTPPTPPEPEPKPPEPDKKPQPQKADKPAEKPLTIDDFDVTMKDYAKAVDQAQEQRRLQRQTTQKSRVAGAAPQGQQSAYVKSVLAVVAAHKPQVYISKGDVYVQFVLNMSGQIAGIRVVESSGDKLLDQIALDSLKVLKFPVPPPNVNPNDLNYMIHYVMH
jgi:TonB family protein